MRTGANLRSAHSVRVCAAYGLGLAPLLQPTLTWSSGGRGLDSYLHRDLVAVENELGRAVAMLEGMSDLDANVAPPATPEEAPPPPAYALKLTRFRCTIQSAYL